jgi:hypothetical protein
VYNLPSIDNSYDISDVEIVLMNYVPVASLKIFKFKIKAIKAS